MATRQRNHRRRSEAATDPGHGLGITRRTFLRGSAAAAAGLAAGAPHAAAATRPDVPHSASPQATLRILATPLAPDGKEAVAGITANGSLPGTEIRARRGDVLRVRIENLLDEDPTSIHWHGLLVPAVMDGVPRVSGPPIEPQRIFVYEFPLLQSGTYWYHSTSGFQRQIGLAGALVIEDPEGRGTERDAVVMLGDWLHRSPEKAYADLRGTQEAEPMAQAHQGMKGGRIAKGAAESEGEVDLADVEYAAFLLNGRPTSDPWKLAAQRGERVRLRLVNAAGSTCFRIRLDGHPLEITHADGLPVQPLTVDQLRIGAGECYDAVVALSAPGSYTLHAVALDGSGQAIGVLHTPDASPRADLGAPTFGGRELSYRDLRAGAPTTLASGPTRSYALALQGTRSRGTWTIDGDAYPDADPLVVRAGERVALQLHNQTRMWQPMHLHGHFFRLLQGAGELSPLKHTVNVAPGETVEIEFSADNPGRWLFASQNLYHLRSGMARMIEYVV